MNSRGMTGKWNAVWHSSPSPKYLTASSGHWLASASSIRFSKRASIRARSSWRKSCVSGRFSQLVFSRSNRYGMASSRRPSTPSSSQWSSTAEHRLADFGIVVVQVGLVVVKAVPEVGLGDRVPSPVRRLEVLEDDPGVAVLVGRVAPHVEVAVPAAGRAWRARWNQGCWSEV